MLKRLVCLFFLSGVGVATAADIAGLGWNGEFLLAQDGGGESSSANIVKSPQSLDFKLEFNALQAGADGQKTEGTSSFSGQLLVMKPQNVKLPTITIKVQGNIVKTLGSTARVDVAVGDLRETFEWKADEVISGNFEKILSGTATDRFLAEPLKVTLITWATKTPGDGAVLVTVNKLDVTVAEASSVANLSPDFAH